jgi:hypothetical protein
MSKSLEKRINWGRLRHKYHRSSLKNKTKLLDELCDLSGMNRKYLIRKFNQNRLRKLKKRGPKPTYDKDIYIPIITPIWLAADQLCSKKLKSILPIWLPFYEEETGPIATEIRSKLLKMSAATLDRIIKPVKAKYKIKGRSGTRPGTLIKNQILIKTNQWEETQPGFIEADTVAHCGNSLEGDFVWSLTMSDILTAWTENRATWNKGAEGVGNQIDDAEANFPFEMKGFDCDNGSEFLNYHLIKKFAARPKEKAIQFTRSRPYKKNDNAHVEQKNWTHVRQLFGYHRFENLILVNLMNDLYKHEWSDYQNHFIPTMKCIEKIKVNSRYKKKFDLPKTPYQRVLDCKDIPESKKQELIAKHKTLNPFQLKRQIEKKLKIIFSYVSLNPKARKKI